MTNLHMKSVKCHLQASDIEIKGNKLNTKLSTKA